MRRHCSRPGCAEPATATLSYRYRDAVVFVDDLVAERNPHDYDLCPRHANRLLVPRGWRLDDRRPSPVVALQRLAG